MAKLSIVKQIQQNTGTRDAGAINIEDIPIGDIKVKKNVRESDNIDIEDLKASIKQVGLLQPITVYKDGDDYICIMGHRRLRAYSELYKENKDRFHSIRAIITDDEKITIRQTIENIQRADLKQIELYHALKELKAEGLTIKEIAAVIGKAEGYVKNCFSGIKEADKDPETLELLKSDAASLSDIKDVKPVKDINKKKQLLKDKAEKKITRDEMRKKVKESKPQKEKKAETHIEDKFINQFYELDLDTIQLRKIVKAVIGDALSKTRGEDRQSIIEDITKLLKQYRGK